MILGTVYNLLLSKCEHGLLQYNFVVAYDIINEKEEYKNLLNYKKGNFEVLRP